MKQEKFAMEPRRWSGRSKAPRSESPPAACRRLTEDWESPRKKSATVRGGASTTAKDIKKEGGGESSSGAGFPRGQNSQPICVRATAKPKECPTCGKDISHNNLKRHMKGHAGNEGRALERRGVEDAGGWGVVYPFGDLGSAAVLQPQFSSAAVGTTPADPLATPEC